MEHKPARGVFRVLALILLGILLVVTGFAAAYQFVTVQKNEFYTGNLSINLNDGNCIIDVDKVEPGMTLERTFFVRNEGTGDFYYRLYFDGVDGDLDQALEVTFADAEGTVFQSGTLSQMHAANLTLTPRTLGVGEEEWITVRFHFPPQEGNDHQAQAVSFCLSAQAVQTLHNPGKEFS